MALSLESVVRAAHIGTGAIALFALALPLLSKKGSLIHRGSGWVYAIGMFVATASAAGVCAIRLTDANLANDSGAIFLLYVAALAAATSLAGIRVVRRKKITPRAPQVIDWLTMIALGGGGVALGAYAAMRQNPLHASFAMLGLFLARGQWKHWTQPPTSKMDWWYAHMVNMLVAAISTVTAVVVVNGARLGLGRFSLVLWLAPGVLGAMGISIWRRYYERKFGRSGAVQTSG